MRVGLFGGSFDPIHQGHLEPVREAQQQLQLDRILYLPTATPPHKRGRSFAPAVARFAMVELALLDYSDLEVSDHELTMNRPAYSVETLAHFRAAEPGSELVLILGADSFLDLPTWVRWREIVATTELAVLTRPGFGLDEVRPGLAPDLEAAIAAQRAHFVENAPLAVSSTEVRRLLAAGEEVPDGWLAPRVVRYLSKYRLYQ